MNNSVIESDWCVADPSDQQGTVILEWAIISVGLLLGVLVAFDVSQAINRYLLLTQAAYEGARFASVVPAMEAGVHTNLSPSDGEKSNCINRTPTTYPCNHWYVQQRIVKAVENLNAFAANGIGANSSITTEYIPATAGLGSTDDTVSVDLRSVFNGILIFAIPLRVEHQMSYLYETN